MVTRKALRTRDGAMVKAPSVVCPREGQRRAGTERNRATPAHAKRARKFVRSTTKENIRGTLEIESIDGVAVNAFRARNTTSSSSPGECQHSETDRGPDWGRARCGPGRILPVGIGGSWPKRSPMARATAMCHHSPMVAPVARSLATDPDLEWAGVLSMIECASAIYFGSFAMLLSQKTKYLILGLGSFVPGYARLPVLSKAASVSAGGTDSARYCYSVWLRHLVKAHENGLPTNPAAVAELGPGDSIGVGLAALLSGATTYYAFDAVNYLDNTRNLQVFDELVELFCKRDNIPDNQEFPEVRPALDSYEFPSRALADAHLRDCLRRERTESIREELLDFKRAKHRFIYYAAPWDKQTVLRPILHRYGLFTGGPGTCE